MERCFIAAKENEFIKAYEKYKLDGEKQRKIVCDYFLEKNIEADKFMVSGNGFMNQSFEEYRKESITLKIKPTENDIERYGKQLKKPGKYGLCGFKKNSLILKEFAQRCVDEAIVINLWKPQVGDYFTTVSYYGCSWGLFNFNDKYYLRVKSEHLTKEDTPNGLIEIKQSEYYLAQEEFENKQN